MGRARVAVAVLAGLVGITAIFLGVRISMRDSSATLATDTTMIPEAEAPSGSDKTDDAITETTFDLGVLAPPTTDAASASTTTPTTAPKATTTTVPKGYAVVHVTNSASLPAKVFLGDDTEHEALLPAGDTTNWMVRTAATHPDSGGAWVKGTGCGGTWSDVNNVLPGREYHFEVKDSPAYCGNGQRMPMVILTDYTAGKSKTITGLVPDATHALIYVINKYDAPVKVAANDVSAIEWTIDPTLWGAPQLIETSTEHGDGVSVARVDEQCGYGDGEDYFSAGHTYRIEVIDGSGSCSGSNAPGLKVTDFTTNSTFYLGANGLAHTG